MDIYGPLFSAHELEDAAIKVLMDWMPAALGKIERTYNTRLVELGLGDPGSLIPPRSYRTIARFEKFPEDQIPAMVVVSPGLWEPPIKDGEGKYRAKWQVGFAIVVEAKDAETTNAVAKLYTAATRLAILQNRGLGGTARVTDWLDETYTDVPVRGSRSLASGQGVFLAEVYDVVDYKAGPNEIPVDPLADPGEWPPVDNTQVTTTAQ